MPQPSLFHSRFRQNRIVHLLCSGIYQFKLGPGFNLSG